MYEVHVADNNCPHGGRQKIDDDRSVYLFLWYIANTITFRQLANLFGVCKSTAWTIVNKVSNWLVTISPDYIYWPHANEMPNVIAKFEQKRKIPHILGAIDVTHIRIKKPVIHGSDYFNKKQYYSLALQAIVDPDKRFIDLYCGEPGSLHDSRILKKSQFYEQVLNNPNVIFPQNTFIISDSGYPAKNWLITPFKNNGHLTQQQRNFNFLHSSSRMVVENAFGLLKNRFRRLLHFSEQVNINLIVNLIVSACVLHNICINQNDDFNTNEIEEEVNLLIGEHNDEIEGTERRQMLVDKLIEKRIL